jgi:ferric-dicitrate binding protein FerR (iron transport regulator)
MSAADFSRFDELVSRYLDERLTDADATELAGLLTEPPLSARFLEMTRLNSEIAGLLSAPVPDAAMVELVRADIEKHIAAAQPSTGVRLRVTDRPQPREETPATFVATGRPRPARRNSVFRKLAWAALFAALAALAFLLLNRTGASETPVVASIQGDVRLLGPAGEQVLVPGQSWQRGETIKTIGPKNAATVTFSDGSRLVLGENCVALNQSTKEGRRVELKRGALQAVVTKQSMRRTVVFVTPEAEAVVVGTALRLVTGVHHTRLEVTEGEVRFRRRHDGAEVAVRAGQYAVVAPNAPFVATPFHPDPHSVH